MGKTGKIMRCNCGGIFNEVLHKDTFSYPIMECSSCRHSVFSIEQAKQYVRLERLHEKLTKQRKVIRVGNALGVTLPKVVRELGIKEGMTVSFQSLGKKALKLVIS